MVVAASQTSELLFELLTVLLAQVVHKQHLKIILAYPLLAVFFNHFAFAVSIGLHHLGFGAIALAFQVSHRLTNGAGQGAVVFPLVVVVELVKSLHAWVGPVGFQGLEKFQVSLHLMPGFNFFLWLSAAPKLKRSFFKLLPGVGAQLGYVKVVLVYVFGVKVVIH